MEDERTRRAADIASDNPPVVAKIKPRLMRHWIKGETALKIFNTTFLQHTDKLDRFNTDLSNWSQALQDLFKEEDTTLENNRESVK
ncbi:unnamed protein product [Schistosoma margrebowiei]|uniref:Uncharacterized protein n=1 Tax=Schistosoma margrebowiei TaxID=48269 RepID=A0A183MNY0_9TREM|nr:unnamed protein product [Schistosoma margrebowiei]